MADAVPQAGGSGVPQDGANPAAAADSGRSATDATSAATPAGPAESSDIDALLNQAAFEDPQAAPGGVVAPGALPSSGATDEDIERMLASAAASLPGGGKAAGGRGSSNPGFDLPSFSSTQSDGSQSTIDLLRDVELNVKIELGRSKMLVEDVLKLGEGSVVELDKLAGDPVDVFVNDRLVARGEVLVLNDNFCVRVNEIVAGLKDDVL
jgi:flagellar motor switch protein FliN/FliY